MALVSTWPIEPENTGAVSALFSFEDGLIHAGLSGMGQVWGNHPERPTVALVCLGDFLFLGGVPVHPMEGVHLLRKITNKPSNAWLVRGAPEWETSLRLWGNWKLGKHQRMAFFHHTQFEKEKLQGMTKKLPEGVTLKNIDLPLYHVCMAQSWSQDFCSLYQDGEDFVKKGRGVVALRDSDLLSGASSYASYPGGIEIQVETREDQRCQGLAAACCAQLVLNCMDEGLDPSWDAANPTSTRLAKRLGYQEKGLYTVWELSPNK